MTGALALGVCASEPPDAADAAALARRLALPLLAPATDPRHCAGLDALLCLDGDDLSLQQTGRRAPGPVRVDFGAAAMRHRRRGGHNELLGRAVGVGRKAPLAVLDATAGLGRDACVLADLGCQVTLCERQPVIAELLRSGLRAAARRGDPWLDTLLSRMRFYPGDARSAPVHSDPAPDVIYLDPMFGARDKHAAVKRDMALLQRLLKTSQAPSDAGQLLDWALQQPVARVVVKRPVRALPLGDRTSSHSIAGRAVRYDVYVLSSLD
ncbi:MAG: class I SAM-dependent methyltransferase [Halioglobus sp.]|nr:class I SAM-dependent methyltransferase [Halioglobus sp.]